MNLIRGDRRSLKYRESGVRENCLVGLSRSPVLPVHIAIIRGSGSPGESVPPVICAHPVEAIAARKVPFEVIDTGKFDIGSGSLIMIAVLV